MSYNPNSKKHKATHGGYRAKPTRTQVKANLDFWTLLSPDGYKNVGLGLFQPTTSGGKSIKI